MLWTLKNFNIGKELHHFLETLKDFNFEQLLRQILITRKAYQNGYEQPHLKVAYHIFMINELHLLRFLGCQTSGTSDK